MVQRIIESFIFYVGGQNSMVCVGSFIFICYLSFSEFIELFYHPLFEDRLVFKLQHDALSTIFLLVTLFKILPYLGCFYISFFFVIIIWIWFCSSWFSTYFNFFGHFLFSSILSTKLFLFSFIQFNEKFCFLK